MTGDAYHHGNLRRALLDTARRLVARQGAQRVTLRAIARAAGVSHAAPYHHFSDREALLAALAAEGFDSLRLDMERAARGSGEKDPLRRLQAAGIAYVRFAAANAELYRLMFSGPLTSRKRFPHLQEAADRAAGALEGLVGPASGGGGSPPLVSITAWSTVHGLAMLLIDGRLEAEVEEAGVESVVMQVTGLLGRGLRSLARAGGDGG